MRSNRTLSDYPAGSRVEIGCRRCPRRGSYRLASLVERFGAEEARPIVLREISAECPRRGPYQVADFCGVMYLNPP